MSLQNVIAIHPVIVDTLQAGPKWWTDEPTWPSIQPSLKTMYLLASLQLG